MSENKKSKYWLILGLVFALIILVIPASESLPIEAKRAAAIFVWMGIWWATEAVPIAVTALIPLVFSLYLVLQILNQPQHRTPIKIFFFSWEDFFSP